MTTLNESELVSAIWSHLKYFIHDRADRTEAATQMIELLHDLGLDPDIIESIAEDDALLRNSLRDFLEMSEEVTDSDDIDDYDDDDDSHYDDQ